MENEETGHEAISLGNNDNKTDSEPQSTSQKKEGAQVFEGLHNYDDDEDDQDRRDDSNRPARGIWSGR